MKPDLVDVTGVEPQPVSVCPHCGEPRDEGSNFNRKWRCGTWLNERSRMCKAIAALKEIVTFGEENPNRGATCAEIARKALEK